MLMSSKFVTPLPRHQKQCIHHTSKYNTFCPFLCVWHTPSNGNPVIKLYVRRCVLHAFQTDDWACMAAILATTGFGALSLAVIEYGAGRHLANIPVNDARIFYYVRCRIFHDLISSLRKVPVLWPHILAVILLTKSTQFYCKKLSETILIPPRSNFSHF